jgi:transglutaminase-like putative cysteine protease
MEDIFSLIVINIFILLIIGFFNPKASLFWYRGEQTKLKSVVIYGAILIILLPLYALYSEEYGLNIEQTIYEPEVVTPVTDNNLLDNSAQTYVPEVTVPIKSEQDKNLEKLIAAVDIDNETTNDYAVKLASRFPGEYNIDQVCNIYSYIVKNWKYVNDSDKMENFRSASRSINNNLAGDCDDFAILIAAMVESIGGDARISFAYNNEVGHAFTEVFATNDRNEMQLLVNEINNLYNDQFEIHFREDKDGKCWLNLDWFGNPQHPGNLYFDYVQRTIYYPTIRSPYYTTEVSKKEVY